MMGVVLKRNPFVAVPNAEMTLRDGSTFISFTASSSRFPSEDCNSILVTKKARIRHSAFSLF